MDKLVDMNWQSAFRVMKDNYALSDDSIGVFAINLRFGLDDIQTISSEAITGGGDDKNATFFMLIKSGKLL